MYHFIALTDCLIEETINKSTYFTMVIHNIVLMLYNINTISVSLGCYTYHFIHDIKLSFNTEKLIWLQKLDINYGKVIHVSSVTFLTRGRGWGQVKGLHAYYFLLVLGKKSIGGGKSKAACLYMLPCFWGKKVSIKTHRFIGV